MRLGRVIMNGGPSPTWWWTRCTGAGWACSGVGWVGLAGGHQKAEQQVPTGRPALRGVLRGPAALEAVPPHVLLGADVVLHLQGPVEDGLLLRRPAQQGELLVQGGLTPSAGGNWGTRPAQIGHPPRPRANS